jgi:hypothetical protein
MISANTSGLLFLVQPMVGKMLLPYLGGAAGVWTTCVLFFQAMLLAGYVYAHLIARLLYASFQNVGHPKLLREADVNHQPDAKAI